MNMNKYIASAKTVGECQGDEKVVADSLNRIYRTLDARVGHLLLTGKEAVYDPEMYDEVMRGVWRDWGNCWGNRKESLLTLTDEQIHRYADSVCAKFTVVLCAKDVCAEYDLNELETGRQF